MKKLMILMVMVSMIFMIGCATIGGTMDKPPLQIDFEYPIKDVWFETFRILNSQSLILEKGNWKEKYLTARRWDTSMGIPIIGVHIVFEELNKNKTRIKFQYNQDGIIPFYKLKNMVTHLMTVLNTNLMARNDEINEKPYKIHDFDIWLEYYKVKAKEPFE